MSHFICHWGFASWDPTKQNEFTYFKNGAGFDDNLLDGFKGRLTIDVYGHWSYYAATKFSYLFGCLLDCENLRTDAFLHPGTVCVYGQTIQRRFTSCPSVSVVNEIKV